MRITRAQRSVLRFGAVMCLLGAVALTAAALLVDSGAPGAEEITASGDGTSITLPEAGLFGSRATVYGAGSESSVRPADLGCRLLDRDGGEQNAAKMSGLATLGDEPVTVDGEQLRPLFSVTDWTSGSVVECADAGSAAPLAVSAGSTFGNLGGVVRVFSGASAVVLLVLGVAGLLLLRRRAPG